MSPMLLKEHIIVFLCILNARENVIDVQREQQGTKWHARRTTGTT